MRTNRKTWLVALALAVIAALTGAPLVAAYAAVDTATKYIGYADDSVSALPPYGDGNQQQTNVVSPLAVEPENGGKAVVAYCFNMHETIPELVYSKPNDPNVSIFDRGIGLRYVRHYGEDLTGFATDARSADIHADVLRVIKNGYPNDAAGLQDMLGLTDTEFRYVTQEAIWYYTDGDTGSDLNSAVFTDETHRTAMRNAYDILTGTTASGPKDVQLVDVDPAKESLNIFVSEYEENGQTITGSYQNLLTATFVNPTTGEENPTSTPSDEATTPSTEETTPAVTPSDEATTPSTEETTPAVTPSDEAPTPDTTPTSEAPSEQPSDNASVTGTPAETATTDATNAASEQPSAQQSDTSTSNVVASNNSTPGGSDTLPLTGSTAGVLGGVALAILAAGAALLMVRRHANA